MPTRRVLSLPSHLLVLIHAGAGNPYAMRINVQRLTRWCVFTVSCFGLALLGSLLFFRELEINRRLQDRVLEFENHEKLAELAAASPRLVAANPSPEAPAPARPKLPETPAVPVPAAAGGSEDGLIDVGTRIADVTPFCAANECAVKVTLAPLSVGTSSGKLLIVLEAEIPRIGSGNPTNQIRKRYFLYPGNGSRDEMSEATLLGLDRKAFRLSRALQTTAKFEIGKLLRPIAANVYLFDRKGTLLRHERKVIEAED